MPISTIFEYSQSINTSLVLEYFYRGEIIEDPGLFFDLNPGLFELEFPSEKETKIKINKYQIYGDTHKLVTSEHGFHLVHL